jgi:hypothetical protein
MSSLLIKSAISLAKRYEQRNIIGQMRQILSDEDAILATKTLNKVADRIEEIGRQYPDGVPLKMEKRHEQA